MAASSSLFSNCRRWCSPRASTFSKQKTKKSTTASRMARPVPTIPPGISESRNRQALLVAQGTHRIDARGAQGGHRARERPDQSQHHHNRADRDRIGGAHFKQHATQNAAERQRAGDTRDQSRRDGSPALPP